MTHVGGKRESNNQVFTLNESMGVIIHYFVGMLLAYPLLGIVLSQRLFNVNVMHPLIHSMYLISIFFGMIWILRRPLTIIYKNLRLNGKFIAIMIRNGSVVLLLFNLLSNVLIQKLWGSKVIAENQFRVIDSVIQHPVIAFFSMVLVTPFVEEVVFRGVLYQKMCDEKAPVIGLVLSSMSFGLIHVLSSAGTPPILAILYWLQYSIMGYILAKFVSKSGTIFTSIGIHCVNNLLGYLLILRMIG